MTNIPPEYHDVWVNINHVRFPADQAEGEVASQNRMLLRIQVIEHLRKKLAESNRRTIPEISEPMPPKGCRFVYHSNMDPAGITDVTFRKKYEKYRKAAWLASEIRGERADLESVMSLFEFLFVSTSKAELGLQETMVLVNKNIQDPQFRKYLLTLIEQPSQKR